MSFIPYGSRHESFASRPARIAYHIDLAADEWHEVGQDRRASEAATGRVIASFWLFAALLVLVIVATPALEAAAFHLTQHVQ